MFFYRFIPHTKEPDHVIIWKVVFLILVGIFTLLMVLPPIIIFIDWWWGLWGTG